MPSFVSTSGSSNSPVRGFLWQAACLRRPRTTLDAGNSTHEVCHVCSGHDADSTSRGPPSSARSPARCAAWRNPRSPDDGFPGDAGPPGLDRRSRRAAGGRDIPLRCVRDLRRGPPRPSVTSSSSSSGALLSPSWPPFLKTAALRTREAVVGGRGSPRRSRPTRSSHLPGSARARVRGRDIRPYPVKCRVRASASFPSRKPSQDRLGLATRSVQREARVTPVGVAALLFSCLSFFSI